MVTKRTRVPKTLKDSPLGDRLPEAELRRLDRMATIVTLRSPSRVIRHGEHGRQCLVVIDGLLHVERNGAHVADLGAGEVAGEISAITGLPCTADVTAAVGTTVYAMNPRELNSLLDACPSLALEMLRTAIERLPQPA
ncbi:MAG: cyclic nucleotide-binding domain-containing protein [Acidimicrobiales bacterium]